MREIPPLFRRGSADSVLLCEGAAIAHHGASEQGRYFAAPARPRPCRSPLCRGGYPLQCVRRRVWAFRNPATRSSSSSGSSLQGPGRRHGGPELSTSKRSLVSSLEVVPVVTAVAMQVTVDHEPSLACHRRGGVGYRPCHGGVYGMRVPAGVLLASDCHCTAFSPVLLYACTPLTITRGVLWQRSQCKVDGVRCIDHRGLLFIARLAGCVGPRTAAQWAAE